jgi:hypothetical protein
MGSESSAPPQTTLPGLADEEARLFATAEERLGPPFAMARESTLLLTTFMASVCADRHIFIRCMAILKTHHTLALLSVARHHHIQATMNLRQVVEAASSAAYALAHPEAEYVDPVTDLTFEPKKVSKRSYNWIAKAYPSHSKDLQSMKDHLNDNSTHFNIVQSARIVSDNPEEMVWKTDFFDSPDLYKEQIDLWFLTKTALCSMHLLSEVQQSHGGFVLAPDFEDRANAVASEWERLKDTIQATPRHQAATESAERAKAKALGARPQRGDEGSGKAG